MQKKSWVGSEKNTCNHFQFHLSFAMFMHVEVWLNLNEVAKKKRGEKAKAKTKLHFCELLFFVCALAIVRQKHETKLEPFILSFIHKCAELTAFAVYREKKSTIHINPSCFVWISAREQAHQFSSPPPPSTFPFLSFSLFSCSINDWWRLSLIRVAHTHTFSPSFKRSLASHSFSF